MIDLGLGGPLLAGERRQRIGDVGQHVEEVALLGVDDLLHLGQLLPPKPFSASPCKQLLARVRRAPEGAQFGLVLEELGQLAEEHLHELLRRHRRAVGMPEASCTIMCWMVRSLPSASFTLILCARRRSRLGSLG